MPPKEENSIANNVNPDQTPPFGLALFNQPNLFENLSEKFRSLRYIPHSPRGDNPPSPEPRLRANDMSCFFI